ncbi:hypothetical protein, partial [Alloprevotella tannerae]|uniref:hypothetical protein n=1 Tax=Alloprevotella tannerae TaxID=76122 RepID=UPI0028EFD7A6
SFFFSFTTLCPNFMPHVISLTNWQLASNKYQIRLPTQQERKREMSIVDRLFLHFPPYLRAPSA